LTLRLRFWGGESKLEEPGCGPMGATNNQRRDLDQDVEIQLDQSTQGQCTGLELESSSRLLGGELPGIVTWGTIVKQTIICYGSRQDSYVCAVSKTSNECLCR